MDDLRCLHFYKDEEDGHIIGMCKIDYKPCSYPTCNKISKDKQTKKSQIITLCGSTKYKEHFLVALEQLTMMGWIVLLPGYYGHCSTYPITDDAKKKLDELHKNKIDMSDAIYVINIDNYIGESTYKEIEYAKAMGKDIYFYETP